MLTLAKLGIFHFLKCVSFLNRERFLKKNVLHTYKICYICFQTHCQVFSQISHVQRNMPVQCHIYSSNWPIYCAPSIQILYLLAELGMKMCTCTQFLMSNNINCVSSLCFCLITHMVYQCRSRDKNKGVFIIQ